MKNVNKYTEFAERFLSEMGRKGCTATEIASLLGITKQSVSNYTSGKSIPPIDKLHKLADYFDVTLDWLLCRPGAKRAATTDIDFFCRYTGLSEKNIVDLHRRIEIDDNEAEAEQIAPSREWVLALQRYMDYSVSGNNTPVDYAAEYMWYEKECVKLAENGNNEELSKLSEEELLKRWLTVREYLRNMELAEYRIAKSFSIKENLFWADVYRTLPNGATSKIGPHFCLAKLGNKYNQKKKEREGENSDGEHHETQK